MTLDGAAPAGGLDVMLNSLNPAVAAVPPGITVPEGATTANFDVTTYAVASTTAVPIQASLGATTRMVTLVVTPRQPVRGVVRDLWADVILGKPGFSELTPNEVVPYKVFNPGGVFVDRSVSPGRAYVWDSGNSRILGFDLATCYASASPCSPQIVIGQPSGIDHSACNGDSGFQHYPVRAPASASSLCGMPEVTLSPLEWKSFVTMAGDAQGNLYVPDAFNNRVLKYVSPFTTDTLADEVWGQSDFSGNLCNQGAGSPTASTLCFTVDAFSAGGVALDSTGNLWVADRGNNRVLRFPKNPVTGVIAKTADLVLGQPDFVSRRSGAGLAEMSLPASLRFGPDGRLYVADNDNNRLLVFSPTPKFVNGMAATEFGSQFAEPYGMETDPAGSGLWVNDSGNRTIELWDWNGTTVMKVLDAFQPGHCAGWQCFWYLGGGIGVDAEGSVLPSVYGYGQDVVRFHAPIPAPQPGVVYQPDKRLFYPPDGYNLRGNKGLRSGAGVAIYGDQLLVADAGRVVFWNDLHALTNGQPFDGYVGSTVFNYQPSCCGYIKADSSNRLWVQGEFEGIHVYQLPLTNQEAPIATILAPGSTLPVLGGGSLTLGSYMNGLVPSPQGGSLWVSDSLNHRVLRVRNPLTSPVVDVVLGQTDAAGTDCNRGLVPPPGPGITQVATADMLCHPGALSFDRLGNLFVSDHGPELEGNWRLLMFAGNLFPADTPRPLYAVPATKIFPYLGQQPAITFEPAFDSANRMVVGYNPYLGGRFVGVYNDPTGPSTEPDAYLNDFSSWPAGIAFDANDNLYVGDANRARLLVYQTPLAARPPTAVVSGGGTICVGSSATIQAALTGTPPWNLTWSDGVTQTGIGASPAARAVSPTSTTTYTVAAVSDLNLTGASSGAALVTVGPPITSFTPASGPPGASVTINGTGFTGTTSVRFNGSTAAFSVDSSTQITATVPFGATTGPISVTTPCGTGTSSTSFVVTPPAAKFYTLTPCRVVDTRNPNGPLGGPALQPNATRLFTVAGSCGIPASAVAVSINATVVAGGSGFLTIYAGNAPNPGTSNLNFSAGQTRANNAILLLATDGTGGIEVLNGSAGANHFILDVNGYFQ